MLNFMAENWKETFVEYIAGHEELYKDKYAIEKIKNI